MKLGAAAIVVLYRQPDTLSLWGIPYHMRPGQSPRDLADRKLRWIWLGTPGWYGSIPRQEIDEIKRFVDKVKRCGLLPEGPGEWSVVDSLALQEGIP